MTLITMPTKVYFSDVDKLQLLRAGATLRSRYSGKRTAVVHPSAIWFFDGTVIPMEGADAGEWRAFLAQLQGQKNTFQLPVPGVPSPLSGYAGVLTVGVAGAAARAMSMPVAGTALALVVKKGDYLTVNGELKVATAALTLGAGGTGTLAFEPGLRAAVTSGMVITLNNPYCTMAAVSDDSASWSLTRPVQHGFKLTCMEAF